jgi:NAD+ kinase
MGSVAVLVNGARPEAARLAAQAVREMAAQGHEVRLLELPGADRAAGDVPGGRLTGADLSGADLAVSLGGDGTFLRLVPLAYAAGIPVLGVNFGRLGYLLEVEPERFVDVLTRSLDGGVRLEERAILAVTVEGALARASGDDRSLRGRPRSGRETGSETPGSPLMTTSDRWWVALNEAVVEKTVPGHMVHLSTAVDGEEGLSYKADGVLVATPTGSTAYSLSAGGPVVDPRMRALIVTPVAPHLAMDRSLVLGPDQVVTVSVQAARPAVLVVDGREVGRLSPGTDVVCRLAPDPLRIVTLGERTFAGTLRNTLVPEGPG